ncbi:MAG: 1-deoxy-D-xylulose-5-phosphate reductoisomerase [Thermomicrobiales bacterium]|nr:1-deoxy-D-xylulose-5-phosphate reductoisomerase [Thermomicrobiales bacterium]
MAPLAVNRLGPRWSPGDPPIPIAILGSTGSIGTQTFDVVSRLPERFRIVALTGGSNCALLIQQAHLARPELVVCGTTDLKSDDLPAGTRLLYGDEGLIEAATLPEVAIVVTATSGHAAIIPTARAIEAGKTIALANKETIVCAGELIMPLAERHGVAIRPVDSEHSAIWQALGTADHGDLERLILTASGGPFRTMPAGEMACVSADQALAHPTWAMGGKITIDSASLMNKGLEVIEAHWLFDMPFDRIDVVVHPESVIHSLVEFRDGSQIAQLGLPDMRLPIQYALTWPNHVATPCRRLSLAEVGALHFETPDYKRFPSLSLCYEAGRAGGPYPAVLSAADEVAVAAFIEGRIAFTQIPAVLSETLDRYDGPRTLDFDGLAEIDATAHRIATAIVSEWSASG